MAFFAVAAFFAVLSVAAANPHGAIYKSAGCPKPPLPQIETTVVQSYVPAPVNIGPQKPAVIEHESAPYEINYFGKPYIVKHKQSAALNVYTQTPVVVDEYAAPQFSESAAPPAVIVEEVCAPAAAPAYSGYSAPSYGGYAAQSYGSYAAPSYASAPVYAAPAKAYPSYPCH